MLGEFGPLFQQRLAVGVGHRLLPVIVVSNVQQTLGICDRTRISAAVFDPGHSLLQPFGQLLGPLALRSKAFEHVIDVPWPDSPGRGADPAQHRGEPDLLRSFGGPSRGGVTGDQLLSPLPTQM